MVYNQMSLHEYIDACCRILTGGATRGKLSALKRFLTVQNMFVTHHACIQFQCKEAHSKGRQIIGRIRLQNIDKLQDNG